MIELAAVGTYALPGEFIPAFKTVNVEFPEIVTNTVEILD